MTDEKTNAEPSGASGGYHAVEFVGGPMDGLRLVEGINAFGEQREHGRRSLFSVGQSGAKYARRGHIEDGILYLDIVEER